MFHAGGNEKEFVLLKEQYSLRTAQVGMEFRMNRLKALYDETGTAPWLDFLRRDLVESGELATLILRDGVRGLTSNPSIFEKAIGHGDDYAAALANQLRTGDKAISVLYEAVAVADIRAAADVFAATYEASGGTDGFVSLEVSPYLANDTEATIAEAKRFWRSVDRPNLMVKVPATPNGIPAISRLIGEGINVNVTLLFSIASYEQVVEAYISGLETLAGNAGDLTHAASVASFFVSRIDTAVEKQLERRGIPAEAAARMHGRVAIANAKLAYQRFGELFAGARWEALECQGARKQRLLWASTGTKSAAMRDTIYVEALAGRDTVNTMPPATMDAFRDHGEVRADAVEQELQAARATITALSNTGISLDDITGELVEDGVRQFAGAFDGLLGAVAKRRLAIVEGGTPALTLMTGSPSFAEACDKEIEAWRSAGRIRKLWRGDASLWTSTDEAQWLGWLDVVENQLACVQKLQDFAKEISEAGFSDIVLLGMGGSSLGPEVLAQIFAAEADHAAPRARRFHILDSTDPEQIRTLQNAIDLPQTLFIISSKSGSTLEPNTFMAYFMQQATHALGAAAAARHFIAITDPGSSLESFAKSCGFRYVFLGVPSIGGRYSVLSNFGMVAACCMGLDVEAFLRRTQIMVRSCAEDVPPAQNPAVQLGIALGVAAKRFGRDKITILASPGMSPLGPWLEQLIAESTGKSGQGLIPVDGEPSGDVASYGNDRFFVYLEHPATALPQQQALVAALAAAGHPVVQIVVPDAAHIGQEFFRWEMAISVAGAVIGINPFNQPDVEASKLKTRALTEAYDANGSLPADTPLFRGNAVGVYADATNAQALGRHNDFAGYLKSHFARAGKGDYIGLLAYIERNDAHTRALADLRALLRDRTRAATCVGFGPRFLHSTGQAYKGGPNSGVFVQITCDDRSDLAIPGHAYSFGVLKAAQAQGDFEVLNERGRRAMRVHLHDLDRGLAELVSAVYEVFQMDRVGVVGLVP